MKTKQSTITALTALEQALKITGVQEPKRDDEFTAAEYAKQSNMNVEAARRKLNSYVSDGKFILRKTGKGQFYSIA